MNDALHARGSFSLSNQLDDAAQITDRVIRLLSPLLVLSLLANAYKTAHYGGWLVLSAQAALLATLVCLAYIGRSIRSDTKITLYSALALTIGLIGTCRWGLFAAGQAPIMLSLVLGATLGLRRWLVLLTVATAGMVAVAVCWVQGWLPLSFDPASLIRSGVAWANAIAVFGAVAVVSLIWERMYQRLQQSESKARAIFDMSLEFMGLLTPDGTVVDANRSALEFVGTNKADVVAKPIWETPWWSHSPEAQDSVRSAVAAAADGELVRFEISHPAADGTMGCFDFSLTPVRDAAGKVILLIPEGRDITERKRIEQALVESQVVHSAVVDSTSDLIWSVDTNFRILSFNKGLRDYFGTHGVEVKIGIEGGALLPTREAADHWTGFYKRALAEGPFSIEYHTIYGGRTLDLSFGVLKNEDKVFGVSVFGKDITERKLTAEALTASEGKYRDIFENAPLVIFQSTPQGRLLRVNPAGVQTYGFDSEEEMLEACKDMAQTIFVHPESRTHIIQQVLASPGFHRFENEYRRKDGSTFIANLYMRAVRIDGEVAFTEGFVEDITERKKAEEALEEYRNHLEDLVRQRTSELLEARNQAEAASRAKSEFLSSMSHELRTPLNAILGFSNMMRTDSNLSAEQRKTLEIINRSGEHLLELINDVLDVARIEAGRVTIVNEAFNLADLVRDITDMMRIRADENDLHLTLDQSSQFPQLIRSDEGKLRQVLINLVGNAVKFTERGGVTIRLDASQPTQHKDVSLSIEVEDTGRGISAEDQESIFEPFVQIGSFASKTGTGLGLTISRQFIQAMGGTLTVRSELGKGSVFRIELPVQLADKEEIFALADQTQRVSALAPGQPAYRILIVEDQDESAMMLRRTLDLVGFQTRVAGNGEEAVREFQDWRPHFIWMDRKMPVMDGVEATKRIRELEGGKDVRIAGLSASAFSDEREEMLTAGLDDFVGKPCRPHEIFECLKRQLGLLYIMDEAPAEQDQQATAIRQSDLVSLPGGIRDELKAAVLSLDGQRINEVARRIYELNVPLAQALIRYADQLDFAHLLQAIRASEANTGKG